MGVKVTNNAYGTLAAGIAAIDTALSLSSGQGARFPALTGSDYFYLTLTDASNNMEIVKVTARSTDALTIVRAQDGTSARAWLLGDRVELRPCAALFNDKAPTADPTFTGTITTPLTASRAVVTGASSELAASAVTATELGYVSGVTSAIQTQLDAKLASATAASTYAALSGAAFTGRVVATKDSQTAYSSAGFEVGAASGDVHLSFHAQGASACSLKHIRNGSGLVVVGTDGSTAANFQCAGLTATSATFSAGLTTSAGTNVTSGGHVHSGTGGAYYLYSYGDVYAQGNVYAYYSDMRLKQVVAPITDATRKINSLDAFTYRKNDLGRKLLEGRDDVEVGVSAQQVKEVLPEAVGLAAFDLGEDGKSKSGEDYLTVQYDKLVPLLIAGFKELSAEVARNRLELKILRAQLKKDAQ